MGLIGQNLMSRKASHSRARRKQKSSRLKFDTHFPRLRVQYSLKLILILLESKD